MAELTRITDPASVSTALEEFSRIGREQFLEKYGFGKARDYFVFDGIRYYDSKAITAAAYGYQYPNEGPLKNNEFSGGEHTVKVALSRLGFTVVADPYTHLVLTENEVYATELERWQDVTGERYHFPNGYKNKIIPGREFVYYKGTRRAAGREAPEYFGWGRVGTVSVDPLTLDKPLAQRRWLAEIDDYREFINAVPAKFGNEYVELGSNAAPPGYWRAGVREITDIAFHKILGAAGISLKIQKLPDLMVKTEGTQAAQITEVADPLEIFVIIPQRTSDIEGKTFSGRRSGRAKEVGDWAEKIALDWLRNKCSTDRHKEQIVWVASQGLTPGWDIEDQRDRQNPTAYEVKGTNGPKFLAIEVTANEWAAAKELGDKYNFVLVTECESPSPKVALLNNPWKLFMEGRFAAIPISFRLARVQT